MIVLDVIPATWLDDLVRLVGAVLCGAAIGWDREAEGREAGLRTHMMVCLGAAGFTLAALRMVEIAEIDPARVVGAIVGGIGFLGAGSIIKSGGRVRGLTTAAGLWVVASIGIACGLGLYVLAAFVSVLALGTLAGVQRLERIRALKERKTSETSP